MADFPIDRSQTTADQRSQFIREYIARKYPGKDPNLALRIAAAEGLNVSGVGPSHIDIANGQPFSFGDFQMNIHPGALGDRARRSGYDPTNPNQWQDVDRFAIDQMYGGKGYNVAPWKGDPVAAAYLKSGAVPTSAIASTESGIGSGYPTPPTTVATAAPAAAPPAGGGLFGVGEGGQAATDKATTALSSLDKALGGKGLGAEAQKGSGSGAPEIQASPIIPGPGAHIPQPAPEPYGQTLNSVPDLAGQPPQQAQGGLSPQIMAMLQQLATQQSLQFPGGLV